MTAKFFTYVCQILGFKSVFATTHHPQKNGQLEHFNRSILTSLRKYVADHPKEWDLYPETMAFAYNTRCATWSSPGACGARHLERGAQEAAKTLAK